MYKDRQSENSIYRILEITSEDTQRLVRANTQRGDAWKDIGLVGLFLEIRTMFLRLRGLIWDKPPMSLGRYDRSDPNKFAPDQEAFKAAVTNALQDLRNYCVLAKMALDDANVYGDNRDELLRKAEEVWKEMNQSG